MAVVSVSTTRSTQGALVFRVVSDASKFFVFIGIKVAVLKGSLPQCSAAVYVVSYPYMSGETADHAPVILDAEYDAHQGATFGVDSTVRGCDFLATIAYHHPNPEHRAKVIAGVLAFAVELQALDNMEVLLADPASLTIEGVEVDRRFRFKEGVTAEVLDAVLGAVYVEPEIVAEQKQALLCALFDSGHFPDARIRVRAGNEIAHADDRAVAVELQTLTEEYYGFGNNTT